MSELIDTALNTHYQFGWWTGYTNTDEDTRGIPQQYIPYYDKGYAEGTHYRKEEQMVKLLEGNV